MPGMAILNLPNLITLLRLVFSLALFAVLMWVQGDLERAPGTWGWIGFLLFVVASATDWVDGYLARRLGLVTVFGRIMDPFVDKVVVCGTFVFLASLYPSVVHPWLVVVILAREFFVTAIRGYMESQGVSFAAEMPGKVKMFLQCLAVGAILLQMAVGHPSEREPAWLALLGTILLWGALASTIHSGWLYARKAYLQLGSGET